MTQSDVDQELSRHLLKQVLDGEALFTPDFRLRLATAAQAYASLAIVEELRRMNDGRDQFHREVLDLFAAVTKPDPGPCASRTPLIRFDNGPLPQQSCTLRHGHEGLHESAEGSRWTDDVSSLRSEQPAAASRCGRRADLATADDGSSVWFTCVLDRGHADFHTDGHGVEWITTPAAPSQQEGEDG